MKIKAIPDSCIYMESMQLKKLIFWRLYIKVNIGCIARNSKICEIVCGLHILFGSSGFSCLLFVGTRFGTLFRLNGAADLGSSVQKHHSEMISIYDLTDQNGARVYNPSWLGSTRKKDMVLQCVDAFWDNGSSIRAKNPNEEKVMSSVEFKAIKQIINSFPITEEMAGRSQFPASFPETPPSTPSPRSSPAAADGSSSKLACVGSVQRSIETGNFYHWSANTHETSQSRRQ